MYSKDLSNYLISEKIEKVERLLFFDFFMFYIDE